MPEAETAAVTCWSVAWLADGASVVAQGTAVENRKSGIVVLCLGQSGLV